MQSGYEHPEGHERLSAGHALESRQAMVAEKLALIPTAGEPR